MLSKEMINDHLSLIEENGRMIDYYLLKNLFEGQADHIITELKTFQNQDGGFGHGLEPDVRLPLSNIASTDIAVEILDEIEEDSLKIELIQDIVRYYEKTYIPEKKGWELVPPEVDLYPRAMWWNYSGVEEFGYGNPNPQIVGFLYQYQQYLTTLDIDVLMSYILNYAHDVFPHEAGKHNLISLLEFYNRMPEPIQTNLEPILQTACNKEMENKNWEQYCFQPYELALICPKFIEGKEELLQENLAYFQVKLANGLIQPNWHWGQYDKEFETAKKEWSGYMTYNVIKALLKA